MKVYVSNLHWSGWHLTNFWRKKMYPAQNSVKKSNSFNSMNRFFEGALEKEEKIKWISFGFLISLVEKHGILIFSFCVRTQFIIPYWWIKYKIEKKRDRNRRSGFATYTISLLLLLLSFIYLLPLLLCNFTIETEGNKQEKWW